MAILWHRIFGMALTQYFADTAWQVDVEVDLSLQQQFLDIVILRRVGDAPEPLWPDGFGVPASFNLITFQALEDALNAWALKELAAHAVSYRKLISPSMDQLLLESDFRMFAVSMRFPRQLASQVVLQPQGPGIYDVLWGVDTIRILVLREMPEGQQNIVWNLFSGDRDRIQKAFQRLQPRLRGWSSILNHLLNSYGLEGIPMPYTMEQFERDVQERILRELPLEKRLEGLSPEERLKGLSLEEIERYLQQKKQAKENDPSKHKD